MPDIRVEIDQAQVEHVNKILYTMPEKSRAVFRNSINRALVSARTQAKKEIKERYAISSSNLNSYERIQLRGAEYTGSDIVGELHFAGGKIPLYKYKVRPSGRRYTNRYVNGRCGWRITTRVSAEDLKETGMVRRETAFIATFKSGHTGIFKRTGGTTSTGKTKLREFYGFSVADMLDYKEARENVLDEAAETVSKRLDQELYRVLNGF
ncbi:MAG: hypothetical protein LUE89_11365 [Clostridiales bacterium]|nr:hypothetical protein [Clostridiales bacterium]